MQQHILGNDYSFQGILFIPFCHYSTGSSSTHSFQMAIYLSFVLLTQPSVFIQPWDGCCEWPRTLWRIMMWQPSSLRANDSIHDTTAMNADILHEWFWHFICQLLFLICCAYTLLINAPFNIYCLHIVILFSSFSLCCLLLFSFHQNTDNSCYFICPNAGWSPVGPFSR